MDDFSVLLSELSTDSDAALQGICSAVSMAVYTESRTASETEQLFMAALESLLGTSTSASLTNFVRGLEGSTLTSQRARAGALNLIGNLIVLGGTLMLPYVAGIKSTCISLLSIDQPADVATSTCGVLDRLCEMRISSETLVPAELERVLQKAKLRSGGPYSKKGARPRGALFRSLGLLLHSYATSFDEEVRRGLLLNPCICIVRENYFRVCVLVTSSLPGECSTSSSLSSDPNGASAKIGPNLTPSLMAACAACFTSSSPMRVPS